MSTTSTSIAASEKRTLAWFVVLSFREKGAMMAVGTRRSLYWGRGLFFVESYLWSCLPDARPRCLSRARSHPGIRLGRSLAPCARFRMVVR
jgi:hypothetical protein